MIWKPQNFKNSIFNILSYLFPYYLISIKFRKLQNKYWHQLSWLDIIFCFSLFAEFYHQNNRKRTFSTEPVLNDVMTGIINFYNVYRLVTKQKTTLSISDVNVDLGALIFFLKKEIKVYCNTKNPKRKTFRIRKLCRKKHSCVNVNMYLCISWNCYRFAISHR